MWVPNYYHIWFAHDPVFVKHGDGRLNEFGKQLQIFGDNWQTICPLDPDGDNMTTGEELGDPCCLWKPQSTHGDWSLHKRREYRRWNLTHPAKVDKFVDFDNAPVRCSEYDDALYQKQFREFYFDRWDGYNPTRIIPAKVVGFAFLVWQLGTWAIYKGLLGDIAPWFSSSPGLSSRTSICICIAASFYMDLVSGVVHLILDYAPHWIPVLGDLARGFQYHHADPTAIIRISWYAYVSHIHLLCPLVMILLWASDASRVQRLFWFWGSVNVHVFQTAHRWAHFPPHALNEIVVLLQDWGLVLTHAKHMQHHEDLEKQFTILSGHTDIILDTFSQVIPPQRYDLWLFVGVIWFTLPMFLDMHFRQFFESFDQSLGKSTKIVDISPVPSSEPRACKDASV